MTAKTPIPMSDSFQVLGRDGAVRSILYPGDPEAPAFETVNCRCAIQPKAEKFAAYWAAVCEKELTRETTKAEGEK